MKKLQMPNEDTAPAIGDLTHFGHSLPSLVDRASDALARARNAAEILEAREMALAAYHGAKLTARLMQAKNAHDALIAAAHRVQADALEIESRAKARLAEEYDAAKERGEVARGGRPRSVPEGNGSTPATSSDLGLTRKFIHEARELRDAEEADPGIVRRSLDQLVASTEEPTQAALRRTIKAATSKGVTPSARPRSRSVPALRSPRRSRGKPFHPTVDRVARLTLLCQELGSFAELDEVVRWNGSDCMARQLREEARAAHERLSELLAMCSAVDAATGGEPLGTPEPYAAEAPPGSG